MAKKVIPITAGKDQKPPQFKSIEEMYAFFLKINLLDEKTMDKNEYIERRRTFYGACGIMFDVVVLNAPSKSQDEINVLMSTLQKEIFEFWEAQKGRIGK